MKRKMIAKGWMVIKIDLEKAYDQMKQEFIKDMLEGIGLPASFVNMVQYWISTLFIKVLW